jgi:ribosomal protein S18 acetylase RimI-like enzyme
LKVRQAKKDDLEHFVEYAMYMPNLKKLGERFLSDMFSKLFKKKSCFVMAEDKGKIVGAMILCDYNDYKTIPTFRMKLRFIMRKYGSWKHFIKLWRRTRRSPKELENSWHGVMIAVHPDFRRKGVGEAMWKKFLKIFPGGRVTFLIESTNKASARWTEDQGAKLICEVPNLFEDNKSWLLYCMNIPKEQ